MPDKRVLLVDLNNFSRYPTIPIGYLAAVLRRAQFAVSVFCPLSIGVEGVLREARPHALSLPMAKLNYRAAVSTSNFIRSVRDGLAAKRLSQLTAEHDRVLQEFERALQREKPAAVLISAYLMYYDLCVAMCAACRRAAVPVLIGGPYFAQPEVVKEWIGIEGMTALATGELELRVPAIIESMLRGEDLKAHPGLFVRDSDGTPAGSFAAPLKTLDDVPFPDYQDFPWQRYPNRIVPVITGRGCAWGACTFCSDVTSTAGRTYRSRSPQNVLDELAYHHAAYGVNQFVFTDLKLNSNVDMWRAVINGLQRAAPGATWIAAVHVTADEVKDNGLTAADLRAAAAGGCVRLTTGLESGSQKMVDLMHKGTKIERTSRYLIDAAAAGISCRCTMVLGYPGETADDVRASADFLRRHHSVIERVSLNRFAIMTGTGFHRMLQRNPADFPQITRLTINHRMAHLDHHYTESETRDHRRAVMRLLEAVHSINSRAMNLRAATFEGVM